MHSNDRRRPLAISLRYTAPPVGLILGSALAGHLAQAHGWHAVLLLIDTPGLILTMLTLFAPGDPPQGAVARRARRRAARCTGVAQLAVGGLGSLCRAGLAPLRVDRAANIRGIVLATTLVPVRSPGWLRSQAIISARPAIPPISSMR
jgi:MFS family permease